MTQPKKLIEVAMPIKEISAESLRDKSIRHGHISTLHLWWARRPLPVCRAVVFASLVPDPLDSNCPQAFKDAVDILLGKENDQLGDPYKPYDDIPYTAAIDKMDDNLRNRLLMFIGKFSDEFCRNEKEGKITASAKQLSDYSLIRSENKNNDGVINKARKLIWVAHNSKTGNQKNLATTLIADFEAHYKAIKDAERDLYNLPDRHIATDTVRSAEAFLNEAIEAFLDRMPKVFDPFAGGGAIPLEAARLGCRSYGNDINPVAHIIQKGSLEYPQKYGKPITYSKNEFIKLYGDQEYMLATQNNSLNISEGKVTIQNRLLFDIKFYGTKLINSTEKQIKDLYGHPKNDCLPLVYYWARVAQCNNPNCKAKIPLLKQFYLSKRRSANESQYVYLNPKIQGNVIDFEIKYGKCELDGWNNRTNINCPVCGSITDSKSLKKQFKNGQSSLRMLAVIEEDSKGKRIFRLPRVEELQVVEKIKDIKVPQDSMQVGNNRNFNTPGWGISKFGEMFTYRQLSMLEGFVDNLNTIKISLTKLCDDDYLKGIYVYLGILIDRIAARNTSLGVWHILQETVEHPFGRQAIPMVFDFPEMYPFSSLSGAAFGQLESILNVISTESFYPFSSECLNASSGDKNQFSQKFLSAVITDPPYYDAIAYADLSDFFYLWLKRTIADSFPLNFSTPQSPKIEECTALKHHHSNDYQIAKNHFENKLLEIFKAIAYQTSDIVCIMFAHQSTEAWSTLCNSILNSGMNITGSWANDTEVTNALKNEMAVLSSSITVSCRPENRKGYAGFKEIKSAIEQMVSKEVDELYKLGFRGADLLTACFGQAVSVFGKYEKVEKADGSDVTVAELLEIAKESAFNALLKGFDGDDFTKFYIGWLQLYGFLESDFDDAAKFSRVGLSINVHDLFTQHILIKHSNKQTLGTFEERLHENKNLGERPESFLIDQVQRAMHLFKGSRADLLQYIGKVGGSPDSSFWRVVTSLCEVLPAGSEDHKQVLGLLTNKEILIREGKMSQVPVAEQTTMFK